MNVLIVDDQQAVIDSLKKEVRWDRIPVEKVYTALSAREARMALRNFDVDVLLTDDGCELISRRQTALIEIPYRTEEGQ